MNCSSRNVFAPKYLFLILSFSLLLASCAVDERPVLRLDDIGAVLLGKTESQIKQSIKAYEKEYRDALKQRDYENAELVLLNLKQSLENAFAYREDDIGASRSPKMFTIRRKSDKGLGEIAANLPILYAQTIHNLIKISLVLGNYEEHAVYQRSLHQHNVFLEQNGGTIVQVSPQLFRETITFLLKSSDKLISAGRHIDATRILAVLRRELEAVAGILPERWSFNFDAVGHNINYYYLLCSRKLAQSYLILADLPNADDMIKVVLGGRMNDEEKIGAIMIAAEIKRELGQEGYARMYMAQALSILTDNPTDANILQFFEFATPSLTQLTSTPQEKLLSALKMLRWPPSSTDKEDILKSISSGILLNGCTYLCKTLSDEENKKYLDNYTESFRYLFNGCPPTPAALEQMALLSIVLLREQRWLKIIDFLSPQIEGLEVLNSVGTVSRIHLAKILKAISISVYMTGNEGLQRLYTHWPVSQELHDYSHIEVAFALSETAKWLTFGQSVKPLGEKNDLVKNLRCDLESAFMSWMSDSISTTEYLNRRRDIFLSWINKKYDNTDSTMSFCAFFRRSLNGLNKKYDNEEIDLSFQVLGDTILCFLKSENSVTAKVSPWPYNMVTNEINRFLAAAKRGNEEALSEMAPQLFSGLCGSIAGAIKSFNHLRVAADGSIGMLPFDLLILRARKLLSPTFSVTYVPFLAKVTNKSYDTKKNKDKNFLLLGDPFPMDVKRSVSYTGNPADDVAMGFRGIVLKSKAVSPLENGGYPAVTTSPFDSEIIIGSIPYTAVEISFLKNLAHRNGYYVKTIVGLDFNKETVREALQGDWDLAHFATHAFFTDEIPYIRESAIYVTPGIRPIDAFLMASEVRNIDMSRIGTVILSACNTGFDITPNGEGIAGIASAFLMAGVREVVLTLWAIDDEATTDFMKRFYCLMLEGSEPSQALQQAKNQMSLESRYLGCRFWAPFILFSIQ